MSGLPVSWEIAQLSSICDRIVDGSHNPPKGVETGYPMLSARNIQNRKINFDDYRFITEADFEAEHQRTGVRSGDVLMTIVGTIGRTAVMSSGIRPFALQRSVAVLRAPALFPQYLSYALEAPLIQTVLNDSAQGTAQKGVYLKTLGGITLPIAPLPEQKRIADKLDTVLARVDACRDRLDRLPTLLKRFRQSILAAATSGRLTADWRKSEEKISWKPLTIGDLCESSFYGPRFGKNEYTTSSSGIPTVRTTDMTTDGRIEITENTPRVAVPAERLDDFKVRSGDLLVTRTGSIGVMAIFDADYIAIPSAYLIRFRFKQLALPRYILFSLMAPRGQQALGLSSTAITQPNVNAEAIKRIEVQLPSLPEQHEIIRRVETLFTFADRLEARLATARKQVEQLTPALLAKAFRGELVPQNPADEPASELLKRLAAQRAAAPPARRGRKA